MNLKCIKWPCILHMLALLANVVVVVFMLYMFFETRGGDRHLALLFLIPPALSILALRCGGDREERHLKMRLRKAKLRQELKAVEEFDS